MPVTAPPCPSCGQPKAARLYVCPGCWATLTRAARTALNRRDSKAALRLLELHRQVRDGVALHLIEITR
jgi:hypothetical protein